ncbi:MAG: hypothetical protein HZA49_04785 [Planctomycetes bacterium]|nr:hypothetical protein [Planctomycetota bacterium]
MIFNIPSKDDVKDLLSQILNQQKLTYSDLVNLITKTRLLIEGENLRNEYQTLNFYCDWCLHTVISRSAKGYKILEQIADIFLDDARVDKKTHTNTRMCEVVSLKELRQEFISLYTQYGIPVFLFTDKQRWKGFCGMLLKELMHKPIEFQPMSKMSKEAKKIYDSIMNKTKGTNLAPCKFVISGDINHGVFWNVTLISKPNVLVSGPLLFTETDKDFSSGDQGTHA